MIAGVASLCTSDFLPIPPRVFSTATSRFCTFSFEASLPSIAAPDANVSDEPSARPPVGAEHWAIVDRLGGGDRGVGVAHRGGGDHSALARRRTRFSFLLWESETHASVWMSRWATLGPGGARLEAGPEDL